MKSKLYNFFDPLGVFLSNWRCRAVSRHIKGKQLVDLACGDNRLTSKLGFGTGVDITDYGRADLVCPDFSNLPFESATVTTVTILAALNYFDEPIKVLQEISRILQPDGVLIVTFLNKNVSSFWHQIRDRGLPRVAYSERELTALLSQTDLKIAAKHHFMLGLNCIYLIRKNGGVIDG